ncbi:MAG: hypothetical protein J6B29_00965 [Clostridia bacterium]|nr:hypothetical protein [Clostridia bacterium]
MNENKFSYTYTAPTESERREVESIRRQYVENGEGKLERLRRLNRSVVSSAQALSISIGTIGLLIFGLGLTLILEWGSIIGGIIVCAFSLPIILIAYPVYKWMFARGKKKHGEEIIALSEEILKENEEL